MQPYDLHIEIYPAYLHAKVSGVQDDSQTMFDYWSRIVREVLNSNLKVVFVEEDFPNQPEIFEIYQSVRDISTYFQDITVIFFDHREDQYEKNKFLETVAVNMGVNCFVFGDRDKAIEKLHQEIKELT